MQVWIVLLVRGVVALTAGPLPYSLNDCRPAAAHFRQRLLAERTSHASPDRDIRVLCWAGAPPRLNTYIPTY